MVKRIIVILGLALAGCTPMRWDHSSLGPEAANADYAACQRAALFEARELAWRQSFMSFPRYVRGRDGRLYRAEEPFGAFGRGDSLMYEQQLTNFCMRNKGYQLVPVK